jgi:hypothetical protein
VYSILLRMPRHVITKNLSDYQEKTPLHVYQTYISDKHVPNKVFKQFDEYAKDYRYTFYDDNQCELLLIENFSAAVIHKYRSLKNGAHKADLFRYCLLYLYGGIYMDVKTVMIKDMKDIFDNDSVMYVVLGREKRSLYNGIIVTPPRNPIILHAINSIVRHEDSFRLKYDYFYYVKMFYDIVNAYCVNHLRVGYNKTLYGVPDVIMYKEVVKMYGPLNIYENIKNLYYNDKPKTDKNCVYDRYYMCSKIYNEPNELLIETRFHDFPWKLSVNNQK